MRLIDADELLTDNTWTWFDEWGNKTPVGEIIFNAPTIDAVPREWHDKCMQIEIDKRIDMCEACNCVEVVRCKECKYAGRNRGIHYHCDYMNTWNEEEYYCSYGERREDDQE